MMMDGSVCVCVCVCVCLCVVEVVVCDVMCMLHELRPVRYAHKKPAALVSQKNTPNWVLYHLVRASVASRRVANGASAAAAMPVPIAAWAGRWRRACRVVVVVEGSSDRAAPTRSRSACSARGASEREVEAVDVAGRVVRHDVHVASLSFKEEGWRSVGGGCGVGEEERWWWTPPFRPSRSAPRGTR